MLTAVSSLSPVSTHNFIPASLKDWMVSGTFSCRRSSIPVAPVCKCISHLTYLKCPVVNVFHALTLVW